MSPSSPFRLLAAVALLLGAAVAVELARDRVYAAESTPAETTLYVRSGTMVEKLALSYDAVLADVYWIRALQSFGQDRLHPESSTHYALLAPFLDLTTSLDPRFMVAYRFGALFLAEPAPGGAGRPDLAIALLEKGFAKMPERWEFCHDIGFVYYWHLHDYVKAAEWFERGGALPDGPWWLRTYAAVMLTRGGDRGASRAMWRNIGQAADDKFLKESAARHLAQLDALDQIDLLQRAADRFRERDGRAPQRWADLVTAGLLRGVPVDPAGTPYELKPDGVVSLSSASPLHPLPTEPVAGSPGMP